MDGVSVYLSEILCVISATTTNYMSTSIAKGFELSLGDKDDNEKLWQSN
jgi:hypothetical protein